LWGLAYPGFVRSVVHYGVTTSDLYLVRSFLSTLDYIIISYFEYQHHISLSPLVSVSPLNVSHTVAFQQYLYRQLPLGRNCPPSGYGPRYRWISRQPVRDKLFQRPLRRKFFHQSPYHEFPHIFLCIAPTMIKIARDEQDE